MNRWNTTQQLAMEIARMEVSENKELNIAQCNMIASNIKKLYSKGGKESVLKNIEDTLPSYTPINGFSWDQKQRALAVVVKLFKWHVLPWSRIRSNMVRIGAKK